MVLTSLVSYTTPGVYTTESVYGAIPAALASFKTAYMLGYSSKSGATTNAPTYVTSTDDFYNQFGTSASANSVQLYFDQRSNTGLYFINVPIKAQRQITISTATVGASYSITIDGYTLTYVAVTGDTTATIQTALGNLINTQASHTATYNSGYVRTAPTITVTSSSNVTLGSVPTTPSYPTVLDVVDTINRAFSAQMSQGFLIAPEFFQQFTNASDRTTLALAMEALVSDPTYDWVAVIDCGAAAATQTSGAGAVNLATAERAALASPKGHSFYYFPYWVNLASQLVPMSASVVGEAFRRWNQQGFIQPPAGVTFPVYGVQDISYPVTSIIQGQLNPLGINCGRNLSNGKGTVIYGARTLSTNSYYTFVTTRVILNVMAGTLRNAYDDVLFSIVDGQGLLFSRVKQTAANICEQLRLAGGLYGATSADAYLVICDSTNNFSADLQNGLVRVDVIVKISPILEVLVVNLAVTSLGTVLSELQAAGTNASINAPTTSATTTSGTTQAIR